MTDTPQTIFKNFDSLIVPIDKLSNYLFAADVKNIDNIIEDKRLKILSPVKIIFPKDERLAESISGKTLTISEGEWE